jgi:hypothetical protein
MSMEVEYELTLADRYAFQWRAVFNSALGRRITSWAGVDRIEQNPEYIFIYTSPAAAHVIPKRAFRDMQEADRFYQFGKTSKEAAT